MRDLTLRLGLRFWRRRSLFPDLTSLTLELRADCLTARGRRRILQRLLTMGRQWSLRFALLRRELQQQRGGPLGNPMPLPAPLILMQRLLWWELRMT